MNFTQNKRVCIEPTYKRESIKEIEVRKWNPIQRRFVKVKIQVNINNDKLIIFTSQGKILRKVNLQSSLINLDTYQNFEQLQYLDWKGEYGPNQIKIGKWNAVWKGTIFQVGGYYENGLKIGQWKQPINNFSKQKCNNSNTEIFEIGEYFNDQKFGRWDYVKYNQIIGGGSYHIRGDGAKMGKWIDLDDNIQDEKLVTHNGEYKNNKKIGLWDIWYKDDKSNNSFKKMQNIIFFYQICYGIRISGGGLYDQVGDGFKLGYWVEISDGYNESSQVTYKGRYKNGKKVGRWDIWFLYNWDQNELMQKHVLNFQQVVVGNMMKQETEERWVIGWKYLMDIGNSLKQLTKVDIQLIKKLVYGILGIGKKGIISNKKKQYYGIKSSGGGQYDEAGDGIKIGDWVEVFDGFRESSQVINNGKYKNGKKFGRWDISFLDDWDQKLDKLIGGGSYDEAGDGIKIGNWVEIKDNFSKYVQVTYQGGYKNGKKFGLWVKMQKDSKYMKEGFKIVKEMKYDN